jgi:hypothetical protein
MVIAAAPVPTNYTYLRTGFPVLARLYATYCDHAVGEAERRAWLASGRTSTSYMDAYEADPSYPPILGAIYVAVGNNEPVVEHRENYYVPTRSQCEVIIPALVAELTRTPPVDQNPGRAQAKPSGERPLLSCLAMLFLNPTRPQEADAASFLDDFALPSQAYEVLLQFLLAQKPFMTVTEASWLVPYLLDELTSRPMVW